MSKPVKRCSWCESNELDRHYHDTEWGVPVHDDRLLFEMLILEGAQAGVSWNVVLKKREHYKKVFANFDAKKVSRFTDVKLEKILLDPGIIRNRLKIESVVKNAKAYLAMQEAGEDFSEFLWSFASAKPKRHKTMATVPGSTPESDAMSKALKKRGFNFVGSTICYAFMQASGMVDDHLVSCHKHKP